MVLIRGLVASFYSFRIVHGRKMCMAEERSKKLELLWYVPSERSGNRNKLKKRFVSISTASCLRKPQMKQISCQIRIKCQGARLFTSSYCPNFDHPYNLSGPQYIFNSVISILNRVYVIIKSEFCNVKHTFSLFMMPFMGRGS